MDESNGLVPLGGDVVMEEKKMDTILSAQNISFQYRSDKLVLENCSFELKRGSRSVLLGSNGAGKSTLFFLLNGVYKPKEGQLAFAGATYEYSRSGISQLRQKVGLVFQDPDVQLFASTVLDDVIFGPMNLGDTLEVAEKKARAALEAVGLSGREDAPPHMLSHGQKKRVALAGVLAMNPDVIIMDEPTAGLDYEGTQKLNELIDSLAEQGKTLLIATHEVDWALAWADMAYVLHSGKIETVGHPSEIFSKGNHKELGFGKPIVSQVLESCNCPIDKQSPRDAKELCRWLENNKKV